MGLENTLQRVLEKDCVIEVFGLGYVGFPLACRLANNGFSVIGIDKDDNKIERFEKGLLTESEILYKTEFFESQKNNKFQLSTKSKNHQLPRIGIICVPTPIPSNSIKSDVFVKDAFENFLDCFRKGDLIIVESSIEVGTMDNLKSIIEKKGLKVPEDIGLCFCPERIDPNNKKWKLENIPRVIYSSDDFSYKICQEIYRYINNSNLIRVNSPKIAEVVKSFENTFRLVNISLVNELAVLCEKLEISVKDVLDAASTKPFGFMPFYPSAGAGGHCIPKDPKFLLESAKKFGLEFKTLSGALVVNAMLPKHIAYSIEKIYADMNLSKSIIVSGLSYKPDIEDMRDSAGFLVLNELKIKGFNVVGYDPFYKIGLHKKYLVENKIPNLKFETLDNLDDNSISKFNGICLVQHHTKTKFRLSEIYQNSLIPFIYDCQNKLELDPNSKTILKKFGG